MLFSASTWCMADCDVQQVLSRAETCCVAQNKLVFNFWTLNLKVGPWKASFNIKKGDKDAP